MQNFFCQCRFKRGTKQTVGYIPAHAAKVGNRVRLLSLDREFWIVTEVGQQVSTDFVKDNERNYKEFQASTSGGGID